MSFNKTDIAVIKRVVEESLSTLSTLEPLSQQTQWHRIPRDQRRAAYDAHAMQAVLNKQYAAE